MFIIHFNFLNFANLFFRPDLVDYGSLQRSNATHNLQQAFNVAERNLGVTKLLDPEGMKISIYLLMQTNFNFTMVLFERENFCVLWFTDVFTENPDEKSIITYVVAFYHYFSKMKVLAVEGKRVGKVRAVLFWCICLLFSAWVCVVYRNQTKKRHIILQVLDHAIEIEKMIKEYETLSSDLLIWIENTIITLNNRKLANSLNGVQQQLHAFNSYRTREKPPK